MNARIFGLDAAVLLPNLAVLGLIAIGYWTGEKPFKTPRPVLGAPLADATVPMHLWEDPFSTEPKRVVQVSDTLRLRRVAPDEIRLSREGPVEVPQAGGEAPAEVAKRVGDLVAKFEPRTIARKKAALGLSKVRGEAEDARFGPASVLVMPVLVRESRDPNDEESRIRTRFAVHAALARAQFLPVNRDSLAFYRSPDGTRSVPYELFYMRPLIADGVRLAGHPFDWSHLLPPPDERQVLEFYHDHAAVMVVWLKENDLFARAATSISRCVDQQGVLSLVEAEMTALFPTKPTDGVPIPRDLVVLGPSNSNRLLELLGQPELSAPPRAPPKPVWRRKRLLVSQATASSYAMELSLGRELGNRADRIESVDAGVWGMRRTSASDERLAEEVLDELALRGARPPNRSSGTDYRLGARSPHIVLVGEWDTLYGRALPRSFVAALNKLPEGDGATAAEAFYSVANPHPCVHEFSYLRGLDGATRAASEGGEQTALEMEKASGNSQFDYLRRLTWRILELDEGLRRDGRGSVAAIGVVGSDVYDKLLVLQALRSAFPGVVFFTTDLDATLLQPEQRPWVRNLLVVSAFGLSASDVLQDRIPPFRSGPQTGQYLAVLSALGLGKAGGLPFNLQSEMSDPRRYEIGRTRVHELDRPPRVFPVDQAALHPDGRRTEKHRGWWGWTTFGLMALAGIALSFALLFRGEVRPGRSPGLEALMGDVVARVVAGAVIVLLWYAATAGFFVLLGRGAIRLPPIALFAYYGAAITIYALLVEPIARGLGGARPASHSRCVMAVVGFAVVLVAGGVTFASTVRTIVTCPGEEPFVAFDGVSAWPTALLRVLAGLLAAFLLIAGQRRLKREIREIDAQSYAPKLECLASGEAPSPLRWRELGARSQRWRQLKSLLYPIYDPEPMPTDSKAKPATLDAAWWELACHLRFPFRYVRLLGYLCLNSVFLAVMVLVLHLPSPAIPVRGLASIGLSQAVLASSVMLYLSLLYMVFDLNIIAGTFIRRMTELVKTPDEGLQALKLAQSVGGAVFPLIYGPFTVVLMLIVSRNPIFDNWDWPVMLIAVFVLGFAVIATGGGSLQHAAGRLKDRTVELCENRRLELAAAENDPNAKRLAVITDQAKAFAAGVFAPWYGNPIYRALLIPLGGAGTIKVLEQLLNP